MDMPAPKLEDCTVIQIQPEGDEEEQEEGGVEQEIAAAQDMVEEVLGGFDRSQTAEKESLLRNLPRMLMPHAWVVHTHGHEFMRVGFEPADLDRDYDAPDLLKEIEQFYRNSMMVHDLVRQ